MGRNIAAGVVSVILLATIVSLVIIPHPMWFAVVTLVGPSASRRGLAGPGKPLWPPLGCEGRGGFPGPARPRPTNR